MEKNWLQDNTASIIAILFTISALSIYVLVLIRVITATENIAFLIINSVTNIMMLIVGYYFGSSLGSKTKQAQLDKVNDNSTVVSLKDKVEDNSIS